MTETENLVLKHLRALRSDISNIRDEIRTMRAEITALWQQMQAYTTLQEQWLEISRRCARGSIASSGAWS